MTNRRIRIAFFSCLLVNFASAQLHWQNVDSLYQPLPSSVHVFYSNDSLEGKPSRIFYVSADLKDKSLNFSTLVGNGKRYTPSQYFEKQSQPLLVVNCTFFEFVHNSNQNLVIQKGQLKAYQVHTLPGRGKDTLTYRHPVGSALGISRRRKADIAWVYTDSANRYAYASQQPIPANRDSLPNVSTNTLFARGSFQKWKMETGIGGGPVLLQHGDIRITNNEEIKFAGKAILDKHPRTAMGYTADGKLIIMVVEGRFPGKAEGATLTQEAALLKELGCWEALNLDGGGSSCLLINGKQTITPSDKEGQRPVPAVFTILPKK